MACCSQYARPKGGATTRRLEGGGGRGPFEVDSFHATPIGITLNAEKFAGDRSHPSPPPGCHRPWLGRCDFLRLWAILQLCLLPDVTFIHLFRLLTPFRGGSVMDPTLWSQWNQFQSRWSGAGINIFWLTGIGIGINSAWPCSAGIGIGISSSFFLTGTESIPFSWNQAQVCGVTCCLFDMALFCLIVTAVLM